MAAPTNAWDDLAPRLISAAAMIVLGIAAVAAGTYWFHALVAAVIGCMVWELVRMIGPQTPGAAVMLGLLAGAVSFALPYVPPMLVLPLLLAPGIVVFGALTRMRLVGAVYAVMMLVAGFGLDVLRDQHGAIWMLWVVGVVVASDVMGYFAGRMIGGPKFWPRVSPKKTWSGTVAGWVGAALVALVFLTIPGTTAGVLIVLSVAMALASQMGDIAESAVKRATGVKDSSSLIPGHGGLMDRFDGMLGAAVFLSMAQLVIAFPPGAAA